MLQSEFQRFLQSLNTDNVPDDMRKIANLVAANIDELVPLTTHQGQRVKRLVALATEEWETLESAITPPTQELQQDISTISQLSKLKVGPFRGFAREEEFDLSSKLVLIYGPNGTGKSSFCEALEYGLLGTVSEAENKRFRNQLEYLKNAHSNAFSPPELWGITAKDEPGLIESDEALYRFCFVEKNRIDEFSRIAAQAPAKQTELISTLFGLDSFNEFVRNFSQEIDGKYLDLHGRKSIELKQKRQKLEAYDQQIKDENNKIERINSEKAKLANSYCEGKTFEQMDLEIHGSDEKPGTIEDLEKQVEAPLRTKTNIKSDTLTRTLGSVQSQILELKEKRQQLSDASQSVSFKTMFEALSQLESLGLEYCPACQTPLERVSKNPFTNASEELKKLHHLASLQEAEQRLSSQTNQSLSDLSSIVNACCSQFSPNPLSSIKIESGAAISMDWWDSLNQTLDDKFTPIQHLETQVKQLETSDEAIEKETQSRSAKKIRLGQLRGFSQKIVVLKTQLQTAEDSINAAKNAIRDFENQNAQLISEAQEEFPIIEKNRTITSSYVDFVSALNRYKDRLPSLLIADLGNEVVNLYNAFNRNDAPSEKLAAVKLPLVQNQRLELAFQNNPEKYFDALHILSEGHIRCVGLAILLAKNIKEECPILIFDDPVNAIDDDHRESIRRTIFEDQYFTGKQIILTCHGEEFFKDVSNLLPAKSVEVSKTLAFLPRIDEPHIRVDFNCSPRNYIIAAQTHFERNELREALSKSRQALETLTKKVWRYINKYGDGNLSIKLRGPSSPIELRNLSEQLKKHIARDSFGDANKERVHDPLVALLGLNGDSREWRYLNKGVHEEQDRAEFDRQTIREVIAHLESIDSALT